jgi:hypothetical protein
VRGRVGNARVSSVAGGVLVKAQSAGGGRREEGLMVIEMEEVEAFRSRGVECRWDRWVRVQTNPKER